MKNKVCVCVIVWFMDTKIERIACLALCEAGPVEFARQMIVLVYAMIVMMLMFCTIVD